MLFSHSVVSNSLWPHGLHPTRLLSPWDSPGKKTGVGCHALLQGIFQTQASNPGLLHWQEMVLYHLNHQGIPSMRWCRSKYSSECKISHICVKGFPDSSVGKESAWNPWDPSSILGSGRSPGEGKGYPLQDSGLENSMGCIVRGVAKSRTGRSDLHILAMLCHSALNYRHVSGK